MTAALLAPIDAALVRALASAGRTRQAAAHCVGVDAAHRARLQATADTARTHADELAHARDGVAHLIAKADAAATRLWQSENAADRAAGDALIAALAGGAP